MTTGLYADAVFKFSRSTASTEVEDVFGQAALFALLSPVLRQRFDVGGSQPLPRDDQGRQEVWLTDQITARGFREVVRYVYRLPSLFNTLNIAEVSTAARILELPELDQAVVQWGLANLEKIVPQKGLHSGIAPDPLDPSEGPNGPAGDAISFLGVICLAIGNSGLNLPEQHRVALAWREAMLKAFDHEEISSNPSFLELPQEAMLLLLEGEGLHASPERLWGYCVRWAMARKGRELPPARTSAPMASFEKPPVKLFVPGARLVTVSVPAAAEDEVDWQRWLVPVAERTKFKDMQPGDFAAHLDAIDPMLPELRQVIYRVRRSGIQSEIAGNSTSPP